LEWRPGLSGVRGLAIVLVMAFHVGLPVTNGGVAGVTLFFVLSGYLITSLLIAERAKTGDVDLRAFAARRMRRLLPAMTCVVVVVAVAVGLAGDVDGVAEDALLSMSYLANWARAAGDPMGLLNHIWSIAIEAQFYAVWPLVYLLLGRFGDHRGRPVVALLIGLAAVSTVWRGILIAGGASDARVYFGTDVRADALAGGAMLAVLGPQLERIGRMGVGVISVVAVLTVAMMPTLDPLWPGSGYSFATIASMGLVAAASSPDSRVPGMTSAPMRWIGERSYSLYLVHVPVFMLIGAAIGPLSPVLGGSVSIGVSALVAIALYELIEQPFRVRRHAQSSGQPRRLLSTSLRPDRLRGRRAITSEVL
jgi:peptidoglycan/LPS O-acetylase OafA/YrhL